MRNERSLNLLFVAIVFILAAGVVGCGPRIDRSVYDSYLGRDTNTVLAGFGPPSSVISQAGGGKIFVYSRSQQQVRGGAPWIGTTQPQSIGQAFGAGLGNGVAQGMNPTTVQTTTTNTMFWIGPDDRVTNWAVNTQ